MTLKLVIAGGRDFGDYELLKRTITRNYPRKGLEIVSGTARGADKLGERFAKEYGIPVKRFPADWDGKSKGTDHMINLAHKNNLHVSVVNYKKEEHGS